MNHVEEEDLGLHLAHHEYGLQAQYAHQVRSDKVGPSVILD